MAEQGLELYTKTSNSSPKREKIQHEVRPSLATANRAMLDLRTMKFRAYGAPDANGMPTVVVAPYAGHNAVTADFHEGQSRRGSRDSFFLMMTCRTAA
jgi:poly(3-hydroxybutyrate) depolymerase